MEWFPNNLATLVPIVVGLLGGICYLLKIQVFQPKKTKSTLKIECAKAQILTPSPDTRTNKLYMAEVTTCWGWRGIFPRPFPSCVPATQSWISWPENRLSSSLCMHPNNSKAGGQNRTFRENNHFHRLDDRAIAGF